MSSGASPVTAAPTETTATIRVMVVDDSVVIRGVITRILELQPGIKVVASAANAALAITMLARTPVDVIILDIEMPILDGLSGLPEIRRIAPDASVIMASTLTQRGAETSLEALRLGAADFVPKPTTGSVFTADDFKSQIVQKVLALGVTKPAGRATFAAAVHPVATKSAPIGGPSITLRTSSPITPAIIGIGSSTGGPQALQAVLTAIPATLLLPIVIVQHMPPTFTRLLADQLGRSTRRPAHEAAEGMLVEAGHIYVAPGGYHMYVERRQRGIVIRITDDPPENFCRPAVDPLFRSLARVYGSATLAVILTGMGSDGTHGAEAIAAAGGTILAQDAATSVVWGMPGAAAAAGICSEILPLGDIGRRLNEIARGAAR